MEEEEEEEEWWESAPIFWVLKRLCELDHTTLFGSFGAGLGSWSPTCLLVFE